MAQEITRTETRVVSGVSVLVRPAVFHHTLHTDTPIDQIVANEVIACDAYKLKHLHNAGFEPRSIMDLGCNVGFFGAFSRSLWPGSRLIQLDASRDFIEIAKLQNPCAKSICAMVGSPPSFQVPDWVVRAFSKSPKWSLGDWLTNTSVDLLKIDIEGSEESVFCELRSRDLMRRVHVLVGEWHGEASKKSVVNACFQNHYLMLDGGETNGTFLAINMKLWPRK